MIQVGDHLILKKPHACGSHRWLVKRTGAEIRIVCEKCKRELLLFKPELEKRIKKIEKSEK